MCQTCAATHAYDPFLLQCRMAHFFWDPCVVYDLDLPRRILALGLSMRNILERLSDAVEDAELLAEWRGTGGGGGAGRGCV